MEGHPLDARLEIDMPTVSSDATTGLPDTATEDAAATDGAEGTEAVDGTESDGTESHVHDHPQAPRTPPPPTTTLADAGELLRALAAPVRIAIVLQLRDGERCVHELVDALDVTQPLISQHLRVLKAAGVVQGERRGREVVYRLVDDHLAHIVVDAVEHVQEGK